jgi:hypothetical protein
MDEIRREADSLHAQIKTFLDAGHVTKRSQEVARELAEASAAVTNATSEEEAVAGLQRMRSLGFRIRRVGGRRAEAGDHFVERSRHSNPSPSDSQKQRQLDR